MGTEEITLEFCSFFACVNCDNPTFSVSGEAGLNSLGSDDGLDKAADASNLNCPC